jgi:hypothetical protein
MTIVADGHKRHELALDSHTPPGGDRIHGPVDRERVDASSWRAAGAADRGKLVAGVRGRLRVRGQD